jgi:hypothetical protein
MLRYLMRTYRVSFILLLHFLLHGIIPYKVKVLLTFRHKDIARICYRFYVFSDVHYIKHADPDPSFYWRSTDQDPDPAPQQDDANLRPLVCKPSTSSL